jgi:hypothetical protein
LEQSYIMNATVATFVYTRSHSSTFVTDNVRNLLVRIIQMSGLDPTALVDDWTVLGRAVRTWLDTGHLEAITIEFFQPGSSRLDRRWDFEITYSGSGVDEDMWVDREHVRRTIEKVGRPRPNCIYRVILSAAAGRPDVAGMVPTTYKSTDGLVSRATGTAIATHDIMAGLRYWRAA